MCMAINVYYADAMGDGLVHNFFITCNVDVVVVVVVALL